MKDTCVVTVQLVEDLGWFSKSPSADRMRGSGQATFLGSQMPQSSKAQTTFLGSQMPRSSKAQATFLDSHSAVFFTAASPFAS